MFNWFRKWKRKSAEQKIEDAIRYGFEICRAHYPPAVMKQLEPYNATGFECPKCGNVKVFKICPTCAGTSRVFVSAGVPYFKEIHYECG